jgi:dipeptidyl aminopeptidase/acylaminoacyl peptidase/predicted N-acetyltransferase YhbS
MNFKIRKMTVADYEEMIALWRSLPGIGLDEASDSRLSIAAFLRRNPGLSIVACDKDVIVGTVLVGHDGRRGFLYHLAVAPSHRKLGVGQALVDHALHSLAKHHIPKCTILVMRSNTGGQAFWQKLGWLRRDDLHVFQHAVEVPCRTPAAALGRTLTCLLLLCTSFGSRLQAKEAVVLEERTRHTVLNLHVNAHWLEGRPQFWYKREIATNRFAFMRVDAAAATKRQAFDHARLAVAWQSVLGKALKPESLPIDDLRFSNNDATLDFDGAGGSWTCALDTYRVTRSTQQHATMLEREPRPSHSGSASTSLLFRNSTGGQMELWWIDFAGKRHSYGSVAAGGERRLQTYQGHVWQATRPDGTNLGVVEASAGFSLAVFDGVLPPPPPPPPDPNRSPDGRWRAMIRTHNLWLQPAAGGEPMALSTDGTHDNSYSLPVAWSADAKRVMALITREGDHRKITLVESSPSDQVQPKLRTVGYAKPGDRIRQPQPRLFDVAARRQIPVSEVLFTNPWSVGVPCWNAEIGAFTLAHNQRGHQVLRVIAVTSDGTTRAIIEERSPTFIDYAGKYFCHFRSGKSELIWMSERSGWNHLYLYDAATGQVKHPITKGPWTVREVERVDDASGRIWFTLSGINPGEDPYFIHHARINYDGSNMILLTAGNGTHKVEWSPDRRYLIDTVSRVDAPPVSVLRDAETGREVLALESADATALLATGWKLPEPFVAKGRDGKTDIYGVIWKPTNFSPDTHYPVIENIYAGPHSSFVPKAFESFYGQQRLAERGFIVVMIDGMGTSHRSKAFHDVCWKNLGDSGFPDRIAWLRAAAASRPWMDLTRVGIYGGSAGGQSALRGLLMYPDFYKAGVADCGCHDNRMDKIWWNELWMGWPVGKHYDDQSNVTQAYRLQGKLMLIVGELDSNVDPSSTLQVAHALIKADKDFDLVLIPGTGHGAAETPYGNRRRADFFVRHLLGETSPHRQPFSN